MSRQLTANKPYVPEPSDPNDLNYLFYGEMLRAWDKDKTPENWARAMIAYENSEVAMETNTCANVSNPGLLGEFYGQ